MAINKSCQRCGDKKNETRIINEIVDRFEIKKIRVCSKCAKKIKKENSILSN